MSLKSRDPKNHPEPELQQADFPPIPGWRKWLLAATILLQLAWMIALFSMAVRK